ncbi:helix-turn-helix domain-containing protein [Clostridium tetani]|uniref:helix-turn-helix domain-containing protein n=1 Tax=Clostridium tetani TaxID=1513 RepID=UPI0024A8D28C|nr:helix-turn-helix transcriptional regulator [Clostridium tetani]
MDKFKLGKNIKNLRKAKGLTQKKLSEELGLSLQSIIKYESGEREPNFETLNKMANIFNVELSILLLDKEESTSTENKIKNECSSIQKKMEDEISNAVKSWLDGSSEEFELEQKKLYEKYFFSLLRWKLKNISTPEEFFTFMFSCYTLDNFPYLSSKDINDLITTFSQLYKMKIYENYIGK